MFDLSQSVPVFPFLPQSPWVVIPSAEATPDYAVLNGACGNVSIWTPAQLQEPGQDLLWRMTLPVISPTRPASWWLLPCVPVSRKDCSRCSRGGPDATGRDLRKNNVQQICERLRRGTMKKRIIMVQYDKSGNRQIHGACERTASLSLRRRWQTDC